MDSCPKFRTQPKQVMTSEPYASANRVFWIVDNGSSHHGWRSIQRMEQAWPTATLVPTRPRLLAEPNRNLLLHPATQSHHTRRLHRPRPPHRTHPRVPTPLQPDRDPVRLALHPHRPQQLPPPHRLRRITPDELQRRPLVAILEEMTMLDATLHGTTALLVYDDLESAQDYLVRVFGLTPGLCNETTTATLSGLFWRAMVTAWDRVWAPSLR